MPLPDRDDTGGDRVSSQSRNRPWVGAYSSARERLMPFKSKAQRSKCAELLVKGKMPKRAQ